MRGIHEHSRFTVIMGSPDKPGYDGEMKARERTLACLASLAAKNLGRRFRGDERGF
jgi:hypothetical protein